MTHTQKGVAVEATSQNKRRNSSDSDNMNNEKNDVRKIAAKKNWKAETSIENIIGIGTAHKITDTTNTTLSTYNKDTMRVGQPPPPQNGKLLLQWKWE